MRTSSAVPWLLALAALTVGSARSFYLTLNSTDHLKRVYAQRSIPEQSLLLLHLFATNVVIDNNNNINPSLDLSGDFGSHQYYNKGSIFPKCPQRCSYYSLGHVNYNQGQCSRFRGVPAYVRNPKHLKRSEKENRARIILCARFDIWRWRVCAVYLTQHYRRQEGKGSDYDPAHTFVITPHLLRELKHFSFNNDIGALRRLRDQYDQNIDDRRLNSIIVDWGALRAPLGLLLALLLDLFKRRMNRSSGSTPTHQWQNCDLQGIHLDVATGHGGKARIIWSGVPQNLVDDGAVLVLFHNQIRQTQFEGYIFDREGRFTTSVPLDEGLQVRLHRYRRLHWWSLRPTREEICRGTEFQSPKTEPVTSHIYAKLQLFVRKGKSCFRLYIDNCDEWKSNFYKSWVALYKSRLEPSRNYLSKQWQWVTKFNWGGYYDDGTMWTYCTDTTVVPELQARFLMEGYDVSARTPAWPSPHWVRLPGYV